MTTPKGGQGQLDAFARGAIVGMVAVGVGITKIAGKVTKSNGAHPSIRAAQQTLVKARTLSQQLFEQKEPRERVVRRLGMWEAGDEEVGHGRPLQLVKLGAFSWQTCGRRVADVVKRVAAVTAI